MTLIDKFSPFLNNPFESRGDVEVAYEKLFDALVPTFSKGRARVRLDHSASFCDIDAADLEGFSRPLWGLVPYVAGGGKFKHWDLYHTGLINGTNPDHPEYWGDTEDLEQRLVEFAAIGFALAVIPEQFIDPIPEKDKKHIIDYLVRASTREYPKTNWKWFHVFLTVGLKRIGADYDHSLTEKNLEDMEMYYLDEGWYGDGPQKHAIDYYNPWAFHMYGIMYLKLNPGDTTRGNIYRERAKLFTKQFLHWFSDDGAALPYGRSLTYKFCTGAYWGALAFSEEEHLPWGVIKGLYLRHLRWWSLQPFARSDSGIMTMGYSYPNQIMCERYNCTGSPYWGTKIFLPLALPETHPFWTAKEVAFPSYETAIPLAIPGMVMSHYPKNTTALVSGPYQNGSYVRFQGEKYCKFAYSTRYGFSVEVNNRDPNDVTMDNMIGFSEDGHGFRIRTSHKSKMYQTTLYSEWAPWEDVKVETWLIPKGAWHVRVHRIKTARKLQTIEGGYAISGLEYSKTIKKNESANSSYVINSEDFSGIVDLNKARSAIVNLPEPNTNCLYAKTYVPQLKGELAAGSTTVLACAVLANPDVKLVDSEWLKVPELPSISELDEIVKKATPVLQ